MAEKKIESELDEREPELDESSDYSKPLSRGKMRWIFISFAAAIAVYLLYSALMSSM